MWQESHGHEQRLACFTHKVLRETVTGMTEKTKQSERRRRGDGDPKKVMRERERERAEK